MTARSRTQSKARIELSKLVQGPQTPEETTIEALMEAMEPYIGGMIDTIGIAAQPEVAPDGTRKPGDVSAAKIGLEFLAKALSGRQSSGAKDILKRIAEIRRAGGDDGQ